MTRLSQSLIDDVRNLVKVSEAVGPRVPLKAKGRDHWGCCPFHGDTRPSLCVTDGKGIWKCFGCAAGGDAIAFVQRFDNLDFVRAVRRLAADVLGVVEDDAPREDEAARAKREAARAADTVRREAEAEAERQKKIRTGKHWFFNLAKPVTREGFTWRYLLARGIDLAALPRLPNALRDATGKHPETGREHPVMLAQISGPGGFMAVHRTFLEPRGSGYAKLSGVENAKLAYGSFTGGSVRLTRGPNGRPLALMAEDEEPVLAEGIENALSCAIAAPGTRALAAVSLENVGSVVLPEQCRRILWFADNDRPKYAPDGTLVGAVARAAVQLEKLRARGLAVRIARPPEGVKDANDLLRDGPEAAAAGPAHEREIAPCP